jgi:Uma2 family endonuclease
MSASALTMPEPEIETSALTVADLLERLGDIPASRVRLHPPIGTATEADVIAVHAREKRLCELVDGTLVEKGMGYYESLVAAVLIQYLRNYCDPQKLGMVAGESGMLKLEPGLVRIPDVSFISWDHFPGRKAPREPIPGLAPDLAVEVLSASNTPKEIRRKLGEYFAAGTRLAWIVDPVARTVRVHTAPDVSTLLNEHETLDGGTVIPGFSLSITEWFALADGPGTA